MAQFTQADLSYVGAFKVPNSDTFAYAEGPIAYNPANDSLYIIGHTFDQKCAEIAIPTIVNATSTSQLNTATIIQALTDPLEGRRSWIHPTNNNTRIGGLMIANGLLYISTYVFYDGDGGQIATHFSRPLNLSTTGSVVGPANVGFGRGVTSAYMCPIPAAHQAGLGGEYLTGNANLQIITRSSFGPSLHVFDPADITGSTQGSPVQVAATALAYYPSEHQTLGNGNTDGSIAVWNHGVAQVKSILFPSGYDSVLVFGKMGLGPVCYGTSCADPCGTGQGYHAYPYSHRVWNFNVADLAAVKAGTKNYWEPIPAYWDFSLPFTHCKHLIGGLAHDVAGGRVFLMQWYTGGAGKPLIHVFEIAGDPPAEEATLTRSQAIHGAGFSQTVTWSGIASPHTNDWIGLFTPGLISPDQRIDWYYLNASKTAPVSAVGATGNFSFPLPGRLRSGTYEFRLFAQAEADDGFGGTELQNAIMATSASFAVQGKKVRFR